MSKECCGGDEPIRLGRQPLPEAQPRVVGAIAGSSPGIPTPPEVADFAPWWRDRALLLPVVSGVFVAIGYGVQWSEASEQVALGAFVIALAAGAWTFVPGALRRLLSGRLGVGLLMTIAAVGAVALGQVAEAAALAFLFSIAEALEDRAMDKAKHGLTALLALIPQTVRVVRDGLESSVPASEVRCGDVLVLAAGDRLSTDATVVDGLSSLDTSAVTGESIPVEVGPGTEALAGSVNGGGRLRLRATADGNDNSLTTIVRLVQEAHARKGERARLADRIARPLVPLVLASSALVALYGVLVGDTSTWFERALVVLVAASPCAMAIAVPVTVVSAIGAASRYGIVIKSGESFEQLGTIRTVAFDKTGTLTRNQPQVVEVRPLPPYTEDEVVQLAAALEASSTHPLAHALVEAAPSFPSAEDVTEHPGNGITGKVGSRSVRVGSTRWVDPRSFAADADRMAGEGMSIVVVDVDGVVAGVIGIRDELTPDAPFAVAQLAAAGIDAVMLTGDNARTAHALAARVGIDDVRAEQLPADKASAIESLRSRSPVAMIGDGINDAPALAAATVGIAMGVRGSAAAIESADVAFTGQDLRLIPLALEHARRGRGIMTQNIALALAIIVVLMPLALLGVLSLAQVVLVHELAEVVVIGNGLRAGRTMRHSVLPSGDAGPRREGQAGRVASPQVSRSGRL
ncbi:cadmium-translocating P-type ATPase [Phycicoccus jejuensis]|uniref:heavy metal translocating P-type ATPase n=1 Tax=Phycicoccus jejuensis TaxID=367299 RepID=UPI00384F990D